MNAKKYILIALYLLVPETIIAFFLFFYPGFHCVLEIKILIIITTLIINGGMQHLLQEIKKSKII